MSLKTIAGRRNNSSGDPGAGRWDEMVFPLETCSYLGFYFRLSLIIVDHDWSFMVVDGYYWLLLLLVIYSYYWLRWIIIGGHSCVWVSTEITRHKDLIMTPPPQNLDQMVVNLFSQGFINPLIITLW